MLVVMLGTKLYGYATPSELT